MDPRREIGRIGEDLAAAFLEKKGHTIIERNWRAGKDEVDLITTNGQFLVFVEVKSRTVGRLMDPECSVDVRKQKCLMRAAEAYIDKTGTDQEVRFDIISIITNSEPVELFHIPSAFYATLE